MQTNIAGISSAANSVKNAGISALKLIHANNEPDSRKKQYVSELKKIKDLYDSGVINETEYESKRRELVKKL